MHAVFGLLACLALGLVPTPPGHVEARSGAILYVSADGHECPLTASDKYVEPTLSPDGKTAAMIRQEVEGEPGHDTARSSLWLVDVASGEPRLLLASTPAEGMTETLAAMGRPEFSLDGGYVYVMSEAWVTSHAIHQVRVATGAHRFVTDGELLFVIRKGRYAGYLMVQKHRYHPAPEYGSYNPVYVVRPDNKWAMLVPGSDKDDGENSVETWMARNAR
jgi:hypothetical protein